MDFLQEGVLCGQVFLTQEYLAIVMEYAPGGDMFQYVKTRGGLSASGPKPNLILIGKIRIIGLLMLLAQSQYSA
jgi:hypothetical protein